MDLRYDSNDAAETNVLGADAAARVLVAVMNSTRDFEIARERGWYRIPLRRAPSQIGADYLAFYHTAAFVQEKWTIRFYAPICGYHIVTRAELLPDEAQHPRAQERYFRIDIGPLEALPAPIPSRKLRRVTFISTTLARLLAAQEINDLWERDIAEEQLWITFCGADKVRSGRTYQVGERQRTYELSPNTWAARESRPGWLVDRGRVVRIPAWMLSYFVVCPPCDGSPTCLEMVRHALSSRTFPGAALLST